MIVSHLLLILHKKIQFYLCLKPEMWQKVAKFKGAEYFRKALYVSQYVLIQDRWDSASPMKTKHLDFPDSVSVAMIGRVGPKPTLEGLV